MKRLLVVIFDLADPARNRQQFLNLLKKNFPTWARIGNSAYLIHTNKTPVQVRDLLGATLNSSDDLFVATYSSPSAWRGLAESTSKWIHKFAKTTHKRTTGSE
jgi:hypothetical protein